MNNSEDLDQNIEETFVTILTVTYPHEAYPVKGLLGNAGIESWLEDENMVSANPFASIAIGGVKLRVRASEAEEAMKVIKEQNIFSDSEDEIIDDLENAPIFETQKRNQQIASYILAIILIITVLYFVFKLF